MNTSSLYAIADALHMPLSLKGGIITGEAKIKVGFASLDMTLKTSIIASQSTDAGVAVLVKIVGELYLVLCRDHSGDIPDALHLWGLRAPQSVAYGLPDTLSSTLPTAAALNAALRPLCAFQYIQPGATGPWERVNLEHPTQNDPTDHLDLSGERSPD